MFAVEMGNMNRNNPDRILNKARQINDEVDALDARQAQLEKLQSTYLKDDNPELKKTVDAESTALMTAYQNLVQETKLLKQDRESGNPRNSAQVGRIDRKVKKSLNSFHQLDSKFQNGLMERFKRDYRIVKPDASEAEMREAVKNPEVPVFSQTLLNTDRRGQAQTVASEVHNRHLAIRKIETDMLRLAEMFQDLEAIVVQQEAQVTQIEQRGEEVREDVTKANVELDGAVTKARAARKKKWICLGIAGESFPLLFSILSFVAFYIWPFLRTCLSNLCFCYSSGRHCRHHHHYCRCCFHQQF